MNEVAAWKDEVKAMSDQIDRWNEQEQGDCRRLYCALISAALIGLVILLSSCAARGPLTSPSLGGAVKQNTSIQSANVAIKKDVTIANQDINEVLKDNAIIARPDLVLKLQDANGQLLDADATIGQQAGIIAQQAQELSAKQKDMDAVTAQGNAYKAQYDATGPRHKRDCEAFLALYCLGAICFGVGPLICKAYPALVFFPSTFEGVASAIAGAFLFSGIVGLLVLFGVL